MESLSSFCTCSDKLIILDEKRDQYYLPDAELEAILRNAMSEGLVPQDVRPALNDVGLLQLIDGVPRLRMPVEICVPGASLLESDAAIAPPANIFEVGALVLKSNMFLRALPFAARLKHLRARKARLKQSSPSPALSALALSFLKARRRIPIEPVCLADSLAMLDFLWRRGHVPQFIIGVRLNPFTAHCWVQTDELLLNEAVDFATAFTPIQAI